MLEIDPNYKPPIKADLCKCEDCGWSGKVSECVKGTDSEGWEYPSYPIDICPKCGESAITDYDFSPEQLEKLKLSKLTGE